MSSNSILVTLIKINKNQIANLYQKDTLLNSVLVLNIVLIRFKNVNIDL